MIALRSWLRGPGGAFVVVVLAGSLAGCHTYTPVSAPSPGSTVRVHIPVQSVRANPNAPQRTETVQGQVVAAGDTLVLATRSRVEYGAYREIVQYDTLRLGPEQRTSVEVQEFSRGRSVALGVGLTVIVAGAAFLAFGGTFGSGGEGLPDDSPNPAVVSFPLGSILLGWLPGN